MVVTSNWQSHDQSFEENRYTNIFPVLLLLSFAVTLFTAHMTQASAHQPYNHDNQGSYSNKESHDIK